MSSRHRGRPTMGLSLAAESAARTGSSRETEPGFELDDFYRDMDEAVYTDRFLRPPKEILERRDPAMALREARPRLELVRRCLAGEPVRDARNRTAVEHASADLLAEAWYKLSQMLGRRPSEELAAVMVERYLTERLDRVDPGTP